MLNKLKKYLRNNTRYGKSRYLNFLYRYDFQRYFKLSAMERCDAEVTAAKIRLLVHALEKGLSIKDQKADFGKEKALSLLQLIQEYVDSGNDPDPQAIELARAVLGSYAQNRIAHGEDVSFIPEEFQIVNELAGAMSHCKKDCRAFAEIARNRHSIRHFTNKPIDPELLFSAVKLAQTAPSACNRQASRIYACIDLEKIGQIVAKHGGLRGFTNIGGILALTGDLSLYQNEYERNTVFVDGGIFLMNLLYALEANELAACPIIWGAEPDNDHFLYSLLGIPKSHEIISLIAIGNFPEQDILIPRSTKRDTETILHFID